MFTAKTFARGASALALCLTALAAFAVPAVAGQTSDHVYSIDLSRDGIDGIVTLQNVSANKHVNAVKIEPTKPSFSLSMAGWVSCEKPPYGYGAYLDEAKTKLYFGRLGLANNQVVEQGVLHSVQYKPRFAYWKPKNSSNFSEKTTVDGNASDFVVPLATVKNGPADLRFDPVALFNAKLQQHVNGGGDAVEFLRKDQSFSVERPVSLGAHCYFSRAGKLKGTGGAWETVMVTLTVQYKGDPAINDTPVLNAQIAGGTKNQLQAGPSPLKITSMQFQPNMPHHVGACPATTKIRVNYMGQGKGEIRIRINDGGKTIHDSQKIAFDSQSGKQFYDFEIETPKASKFDLNKTVAHSLTVYVRGKDENEQLWPATYQPMDNATWKHRCTPQVNPALGGGAVGGYKKDDDGGATPAIIRRAQ
ncbi:MAG: hypothetical protein Kow00114_01230 [Kiloniellaceae bacterium]